MSDLIKESVAKRQAAESSANRVIMELRSGSKPGQQGLVHGQWLEQISATRKMKRFSNPLFALLGVFAILFLGSLYLFERLPVAPGDQMYAIKLVVASMFAVSLGFILSVWWNATSRFDSKLREARRIDREYRELLISFSDSLFDIINALNTLAAKPPKAFVVAAEFLLGEYIHLLQSQLLRYGDYIAGLGFDATAFLDEKIRIFEGIRERASLSVKGMPKEIETLFVQSLSLRDEEALLDERARRQRQLQEQLASVGQQHVAEHKMAS
jgi:hypothetical protein